MLQLIRCCAIVGLLTALPALAQAQANYPDRPVRFIVAFPPGGATDTFFRQITTELGTALGQPVVVDNRGGAGGYVGWQAIAAAEPDGYTLLVAENAIGINQALYKQHASGFDPLKHLDAVAVLASAPLVMGIANNLPPNNFKEFVAYAKSVPQKVNYAQAGAGSVSHLVYEVIKEGAGFDAVGIPYRGGGPAAQDVVAGHVASLVSAMAVGKPLVEGNKIKGIAVTSQQRSAALPNVPSLKELGVKHAEVDLEFWWAIFGPKGLPEPVKAKLERTFQTVMNNPSVRERLNKVDTNVAYAPGAALRTKLENEIKNWTTFIDAKGIKPE